MCAAAPKGPATKAPEVIAPNLTLIDEDSPGDARNKLKRGRAQVTNTGLNIPTPGGTQAGPAVGISIPAPK